MNDEIRKKMMETYFDGGVSLHQVKELGPKRPEIGEFLKFALEHEGVPFQSLWNFGGLEFVFSYEADFKTIGVDGEILASCMDADSESIRFVCIKILESLAHSKTLGKVGETHLVSRGLIVSLTAVKAFILATLDAKERYQVDDIISELYFLLSIVLFPGEPEVNALQASKNLRFYSAYIAWAFHHKHGNYPSYRVIAKLLGVAPSTISRLFKSREDFEVCVDWNGILKNDPSTSPTLKYIYPVL